MEWNIKKTDQNMVKEYMEHLNVDEVFAKILINRGISYDTADMLLNNPYKALKDPKMLINVEQGAREIIEAVELGAEIWVFADYDCDGLTSGYVMTDFLRKTTNNTVHVFFPDRTDGYGLNMDFCETLINRRNENNIEHMMLITVDNGTSCIEEVKYLKEHGIRVLVTDHHEGKEVLPDCTVINSHISDEDTYHHLCGCGTAFKTIQVVQDLVGMNHDYVNQYLFAVAIGTVADVMPMTAENIAFVKLGLEQLNSKDCPVALKTFKAHIGKMKMNASDIAWELAPRLNATGRMGDIDKGAMLFFMGENDDLAQIKDIVLEIDEINEARKALTKKAETALAKVDFSNDNVCIFDASAYPAGITGIIAGRVAEKNGKVAMAMSGQEVLTGSARAPQGLNLQTLFKNQFDIGNLESYGGHAQAAGFKVRTEKIDELRESMNKEIKEILESMPESSTEQMLTIDCEISLAQLNKKVYESIHKLPYDKNVLPAPTFSIPKLKILRWKTSKNNEDNICFDVMDENGKQLSIWAWKFGNEYKAIGTPEYLDIAGRIDANFMKRGQYTINVDAIRPATASF